MNKIKGRLVGDVETPGAHSARMTVVAEVMLIPLGSSFQDF